MDVKQRPAPRVFLGNQMHAQATEHVWKVSVNANEDIVESVARRGRVEAAAVMVRVTQ